ncbi:MAG: extracellular solute-binding protein [Lachnospiraceae bacterium]|nr:extracellular solute-binding protein [Lachnospiraceae bacterium]
MKKKWISLMLAAALTATALAGCGNSGKESSADAQGAGSQGGTESSADAEESEGAGTQASSDSEKIVLEFFNQKVEAESLYNDVIIPKFQEEYPNVEIEVVSPSDAETVFFTRVSTNDMPDIMSIYPAEYSYRVIMQDGLLADLSGKDFLSRASKSAIEYSTYDDGKLYAMPYGLSSYGIYCNLDMFTEAGLELPETWDELIACLDAFVAKGMEKPLIFDGKGSLAQFAERLIGIVDKDFATVCEAVGKGEGSFADADKNQVRIFSEALLELAKYAPDDILGIGRDQGTADFCNGVYPMYIGGTFYMADILAGNADLNCTMIPIPKPDGGYSLPINVDIALGYYVETEHPEICEAFIEFMSRPEIYQIMADNEGTPTCIEGVDYKITALQDISKKITGDDTFLTLVNFWPSGWRTEWTIYVQNLISDGDIDALITETDRICKDYYNQ